MLYCKECDNGQDFFQCFNSKRRKLLNEEKEIKKGEWTKDNKGLKDDIYCTKCNSPLGFTDKMIEHFQLDDYPIIFKRFTLDNQLNKVKKLLGNSIEKIQISNQSEQNNGKFDYKKANVPNILVQRFKEKSGIDLAEPYLHQAIAIDHIFNGKNVIVSTPTASGKSLIYTVPIFTQILNDRNSTALIIFPTKALSLDQMGSFLRLGDDFNEFDILSLKSVHSIKFDTQTVICGKFDGDTKKEDQKYIKKSAKIIITNPDALHFKILPHLVTKSTGSWKEFFYNLRFIVLDEIHTYRGTFGANVALLLRRLQLICQKLGNENLQFICASATIKNPIEHAERLIGRKFELVDENSGPIYKKAFVLVNPPIKDKNTKDRIEPITINLDLLQKVFIGKENPSQTISFARSRAAVEDIDEKLQGRLKDIKSPFFNRTGIYKSTIKKIELVKIQHQLKNRELVHISTTNALELGIDIGDLEVCIMNHYPGNIASVIQQSGRVGRTSESMAILILKNNPLEQYFARFPEFFFDQFNNLENAKIPIENKYLLENHILCANWESKHFNGYSDEEYSKTFGLISKPILEDLKNNDFIYEDISDRGELYWKISHGGPGYKDRYKNIRIPLSIGTFKVVEEESEEEVGNIDSYTAPRDLFEGAVWRNNGVYYLSRGFGPKDKQIYVRDLGINYDYFTIAMPKYEIIVNEEKNNKKVRELPIANCDINVTREIMLYKKVFRDGSNDETCTTWTNPISYDTDSLLVTFTDEIFDNCQQNFNYMEQIAAIHGFEHIFRSILPIVADCDPNDLNSWFDEDQRRIFFFDTMAGGIGYSLLGFDKFNTVIKYCHQVIYNCKCENGCPQCLIVPWCVNEDAGIDKAATLRILEELCS